MVLGAVVAALYDLQLDFIGVMYVLANDVLTSLVGVLMEKKMDAKDINSWGLMFYNSLFSVPVLMLYMYAEGSEVRGSVFLCCALCPWSNSCVFPCAACVGQHQWRVRCVCLCVATRFHRVCDYRSWRR